MGRWVALLRGVNVGGAHAVPMAELRALARGLGWGRVESHIASGNLVFDAEGDAEALAAELRQAMRAGMGVDVPVLVVAGEDLAARVAGCPFDPVEGRHVHGFLLFGEARLDAAELAALKVESEEVVMQGRTVWLHAPEGIGRSKLAEKFHKLVVGADMPVQMTARNLNTLRKLALMAAG
jgi:uncharacterized protein (DUF1697 family)